MRRIGARKVDRGRSLMALISQAVSGHLPLTFSSPQNICPNPEITIGDVIWPRLGLEFTVVELLFKVTVGGY